MIWDGCWISSLYQALCLHFRPQEGEEKEAKQALPALLVPFEEPPQSPTFTSGQTSLT